MITFPDDVKGWLTVNEGRKLAELARGKRVLEVGSYHGRSTICMAQTAAKVVSVDWHKGDEGAGFGDSEPAFRANIKRYGVEDKVEVHVCRSDDFKSEEKFDLVFVDGAHDQPAVVTDLCLAIRCLVPGGTIAMHDWDYQSVQNARHEVLGSEWRAQSVDRLGWLVESAGKKRPLVFVGMPRYSEEAAFGAVKAMLWPTRGACDLVSSEKSSPRTSLLDHCFNQIWAEALDQRDDAGATHLAMIHADVEPPMGWLDDLYEEMVRLDAHIVSGVIPIKNSCALTSTAINPNDCFADFGTWVPRRLTMKEVVRLPETFGAADVGCPLLLNTGLWICDLRNEWVDKVCFDSVKRIVKKTDGKRVAQCISEDWFLSNTLNQMGYADKLFATRKIKVLHHGERTFKNWDAWGLWETDKVYEEVTGQPNPPIGEPQCVSSS
jgi:SAM-dependent methyltransferase